MNITRKIFDELYDLAKPLVFKLTKNDPEKAHELFINFARTLCYTGLEKLVLNNSSNGHQPSFKISNAAGLNKNAEIPPNFLKYLGFDRVNIGTITFDSWKGNNRPRTVRFPETESLINWMGLPGEGANIVADRLLSYGAHGVPLTINIMSTPGKKGDDLLSDIENTILACRCIPYVDRFEVNITCPNTLNQSGSLDARNEYQKYLGEILRISDSLVYHPWQEVYVKVSPDSDEPGIDGILEVVSQHKVNGITATNTTTKHDSKYISSSPGKGGASGNAVYKNSLKVHKLFYEKIIRQDSQLAIAACGGINSLGRLRERLDLGASEIQIYTPLIFTGPKLLREFREYRG